MHSCYSADALQLGSSAEGGVQVWNSSLPGGLLFVAGPGCAASQPAATGCGTAEPTRSSWGVESSSYIKRRVLNFN